MRRSIVVFGMFFAACVAVRPSKQPPANAEFKNLRVLPSNISRDDLIVTMRAWSQSLGSNCGECHVRIQPAEPGGRARLDFVSDAQPNKIAARAMLTMTRRMNAEYVTRIAQKGSSVTCYTCHRGKSVPESTLPPKPPAAEGK